MDTLTNLFFGRIAAPSVSERVAFGGARNPLAHKCIPVAAQPVYEFEARYDMHLALDSEKLYF